MHGIGLPGVSKSAKITHAERLYYLFLARLREGVRNPFVMLGAVVILMMVLFVLTTNKITQLEKTNKELQNELVLVKGLVQTARQDGIQDSINALYDLQIKSIRK